MTDSDAFDVTTKSITYHAEGVTETTGLLIGQPGQSANAAERSCQIRHLVNLRVMSGGGSAISPEEHGRWDTVQIVILGRVRWSIRNQNYHLLKLCQKGQNGDTKIEYFERVY